MAEREKRYEIQDVTAKPVLIAAASILVFAVLTMVVTAVLQNAFQETAEPAAASMRPAEQVPAPEPLLQVDPAADWQAVKAATDSVLNSYGWIQPDSGIVRIPIGRAMALVAKEGLPVQIDTTVDSTMKQ